MGKRIGMSSSVSSYLVMVSNNFQYINECEREMS
jgi:hypothetical protein